MTGPIDPRRLTTVYRFFDADGQLLYVGTSADLQARWEQHAREKLWWTAVDRASVHWYPTRREALAEERRAIREERPVHNDKGSATEAVFPYQGRNHSLSMETRLRRAAADCRRVVDRLSVTVERAAASGLSTESIAIPLGLTEGEVMSLAQRMVDGGGISTLILLQGAAVAPPAQSHLDDGPAGTK